MRRATAIVLAVQLAACLPIGQRGGWILTGTGAAVAIIGAGITYESESSQPSPWAAAVPGIVIAAIGLFFVIDGRPPPPKSEPDPGELERAAQTRQEIQAQREAAWQLTQEAQAAARAGNCTRVIEIDPNVKVMDGELYASTFITDVAIQRCIGSPTGH